MPSIRKQLTEVYRVCLNTNIITHGTFKQQKKYLNVAFVATYKEIILKPCLSCIALDYFVFICILENSPSAAG